MRDEKNDFGKIKKKVLIKEKEEINLISSLSHKSINHFNINLIENNPYHLISLILTIFMKKGGDCELIRIL